jgi:hypothetical protein
MTQARVRPLLFGPLSLVAVLASMAPATAQTGETRAPAVEQPAAQTAEPVRLSQDAQQTRQELESILKRLPPAVGRVLRTDPSLMRNQSYLSTYPALATFLQQHPEVANNAGYYLENITLTFWNPPTVRDPRSDAIYMWRNFIEGLAMMAVFLVIVAGIIWLVRTALDHRKWHRAFKAQSEMHNKLLDRFTSNEDLLAYIQTAPGRQFVDPVPQPLEVATRPHFSPISRILWSVQAGLVLAAGAIGLLFISRRVIEEVAQVFFAAGVLALALGIGFVVSAAASLLLSQRFGLLGTAATREHSGA